MSGSVCTDPPEVLAPPGVGCWSYGVGMLSMGSKAEFELSCGGCDCALLGIGVAERLGICGRGEKEKFGEKGRLRLFTEPLLLFEIWFVIPLVEGGVKGGRDAAGEGTRLALVSLVETNAPAEGAVGGWVADVGVGSGGGADCVGALEELVAVDLRFLFGCPLVYALLDGNVGAGWYRFGFAIPLFMYTLLR